MKIWVTLLIALLTASAFAAAEENITDDASLLENALPEVPVFVEDREYGFTITPIEAPPNVPQGTENMTYVGSQELFSKPLFEEMQMKSLKRVIYLKSDKQYFCVLYLSQYASKEMAEEEGESDSEYKQEFEGTYFSRHASIDKWYKNDIEYDVGAYFLNGKRKSSAGFCNELAELALLTTGSDVKPPEAEIIEENAGEEAPESNVDESDMAVYCEWIEGLVICKKVKKSELPPEEQYPEEVTPDPEILKRFAAEYNESATDEEREERYLAAKEKERRALMESTQEEGMEAGLEGRKQGLKEMKNQALMKQAASPQPIRRM